MNFASIAKRLFLIVALLGMLLAAAGSVGAEGNVYRVTTAGTSANDGLSWAAAVDLQTALTRAGAGDQIWVAAGTYRPTSGTDRTATFTMKDGVAIYGGFPAAGGDWTSRDWANNVTTLSGDIGAAGDASDNDYHVVTTNANLTASAVLDGFTITGGFANGDPTNPWGWGGGMWLHQGSPTLANLRFAGNQAGYGGGAGLYVDPCDAYDWNCVQTNPTLTDIVFEGNTVPAAYDYDGGGMRIGGQFGNASLTAPTLTNVKFMNNSARLGGGLAVMSAAPVLSNVTFTGNTASSAGGGLDNYEGVVSLTGGVFSGNTAPYGGGVNNNPGTLNFTNVAFLGNVAAQEGGGLNEQGTSTIVNAVFSGNQAQVSSYGGGGAVRAYYGGHSVLINATFYNNSASDGSAAIAYGDSSTIVDLKDSIVYGNTGGSQISRGISYWEYGQVNIANSLIEGGCPNGATCSSVISGNPLFANTGDPDGADNTIRTADDGLSISATSPAIDAGSNSLVPAGITTDLAGQPRFHDDLGMLPNATPAPVDMGAYEFQGTSPPPNNTPVVNAGADGTLSEGATFSQAGSFTDPDADSWTATVDYGDGGGPVSLPLTGKTFSLSHVYADNGGYTIAVTVNDGNATGTDTVLLTVNNMAPVVNAGADAAISAGASFSQAGSFADPGADSWTATVNYGDGGGAVPLTLSGKTLNLSHSYATAGSYVVTVVVTEADSEAASGQDTVTVVVGDADVRISLQGAPNRVKAGDDLIYPISVSNRGPDEGQNVMITLPVPNGTTFKSLHAPDGWICTTPGVGLTGNVICSKGSVANHESAIFQFEVKVDSSVEVGTILSLHGSASSATVDPRPTNNSETTATTVVDRKK